MDSMDIDVKNSATNSPGIGLLKQPPRELSQFLAACLRKRIQPSDFPPLVSLFCQRHSLNGSVWCQGIASLHNGSFSKNLLIDYFVVSLANNSPLDILSLWPTISETPVLFQDAVLIHIANTSRLLDSLVTSVAKIESDTWFSTLAVFATRFSKHSLLHCEHMLFFLTQLTHAAVNSVLVPKTFCEAMNAFSDEVPSELRLQGKILYENTQRLLDARRSAIARADTASIQHSTVKVRRMLLIDAAVRLYMSVTDDAILQHFKNAASDDKRTTIKLLVSSSFELFGAISAGASSPVVLRAWRLYLEKTLPLLILRLQEGTSPENPQDECKKLLENVKNDLPSPSSQGAILEALSLLTTDTISHLLRASSDSSDALNAFIVSSKQPYPTLTGNNGLDVRHGFMKSSIALGLLVPADYVTVLGNGVLTQVETLSFSIPFIDASGEPVSDIPSFVHTLFADKTPELEAVDLSQMAQFVAQVPAVLPVMQYSFSVALWNTVESLVKQGKGTHLRTLSLVLLLDLQALDIVVLYLSPKVFVHPLVAHLQSYLGEDGAEDLSFQDTFTDFGCVFLLLIYLFKRYGLSQQLFTGLAAYVLEDLGGRPTDDGPSSPVLDQGTLKKWTQALFYLLSGLLDELVLQCSVRQCYKLVTEIFRQAFTAHVLGLIDLALFQNGTEYFFQPFLLVPLLSIFGWLEDVLWAAGSDKRLVELVTAVVELMLSPVLGEEARVIHGLIVQYVAPLLSRALEAAGGRSINLLADVIKKGDASFNLQLSASLRIFDCAHVGLHCGLKLVKSPLDALADQAVLLAGSCFPGGPSMLYDPYIPIWVRKTVGKSGVERFLNDAAEEVSLGKRLLKGVKEVASLGVAMKDVSKMLIQ